MEPYLNITNVTACVAAAAFFAAFTLTFWPNRLRLALATVLYGIGIMGCLSPYFYFHFFNVVPGATLTFGRFPTLDWLLPMLLPSFGIVSVILLWPAIPQQVAAKCGAVLFFCIAPVLVFLLLLPGYLQFHRFFPIDPKWLLYALLWFRILGSREQRGAAA